MLIQALQQNNKPDFRAIFLNEKKMFQNIRFLETEILLRNKHLKDLLETIQFTYVSQNTYV
jgi:hypothetical protein